MIKRTLAAGAFAIAAMTGGVSQAAVIDLGFIMDESGSMGAANYAASMNALADALDAAIPVGGTNTYRIGVVAFGSIADTVVAPVEVTSAGILSTLTAAIRAEGATNYANAGSTNYNAAFTRLAALFNAAGGTNDTAIVNMTTDGANNDGGSPDTDILKDAGFDALSFEGVGPGLNSTTLAVLCRLAYDTSGDGCDLNTSDPADINDPLNQSFVLQIDDFGADYEAAMLTKIQKTVTPDPVPVPAALPLLLAGLGAFGFISRRRKQA